MSGATASGAHQFLEILLSVANGFGRSLRLKVSIPSSERGIRADAQAVDSVDKLEITMVAVRSFDDQSLQRSTEVPPGQLTPHGADSLSRHSPRLHILRQRIDPCRERRVFVRLRPASGDEFVNERHAAGRQIVC